MSKKSDFNSPFIKYFKSDELLSKDETSGIVYHYTSPEAFLSIIKYGGIRFTDARFMNDKSEGKYVVKCLVEFSEKNKLQYPTFCEGINVLLKENDFESIKKLTAEEIIYSEIPYMPYKSNRSFLFCMCQDSDLLGMWNYYVNNGNYQGYNIGLKLSELLKTFDTDSNKELDAFMIYYGQIIYSQTDQFAELEKLAHKTENKYANKINGISYAAIDIRHYIDSQGLFFKSPKFAPEKEYRIIISIANERIPHNTDEAAKYFGNNNKKMYEDFCTKKGLIVPFLNVALPTKSISRITMSPITEFGVAKAGIKELLELYQDKSIPVYKSQIPIRF